MAAADEFTIWLGNKLQELNTDEGVFGAYITGILDGDETQEEKIEALEGILSEICEVDITPLCLEILDMFTKHRSQSTTQSTLSSEDVDDKLVRLLESQTLTTTVQREYTAEERKIKDAILAQYSQMTDDEEEDVEECAGDTKEKENGLERNTNAYSVQQAEKEKREVAKQESQKKKDKDKEDREKQKQMKEDKKEKRKTQKGERRR